MSNVSSQTSSLQSSGQSDLPMWSVLSNEGSVTSPHDSDDERHRVNNNDIDSDDEVPRKKQKIQTASIIGNAGISTNVLGKSRDTIIVDDDGSRKRKLPILQKFVTPTALADTRVIHVAIPNPEPSPTTTISSNDQGNPTPTRKKLNGLYGLAISRPLAMSKSTSTSDSLNSGVHKDHTEPHRTTRGQALVQDKPTNWSHGTRSKKGYVADQDELESWTSADIAHTTFRKPDELKALCELEEQNTKRNVSHIFKSFMGTEGSNGNVARNEWKNSNCIQIPIAIPDSSFYTRCDDLVEEIFGPDSRKRGTRPKMVHSLFF